MITQKERMSGWAKEKKFYIIIKTAAATKMCVHLNSSRPKFSSLIRIRKTAHMISNKKKMAASLDGAEGW